MEASKSLRRPINWQDFESLCKKLWGEIWNCSEIKKNGRAGQSQNGVDICGVPKGESQFYGIQCKGKDEYTDKQFTENEILREIENAKQFKPDLKKLYFTTTAVKDAKIEAFIREKNIEHLNAGLFEVHLFSWEDIVELIDENRQTHDWYLNSQKFKTKKEAKITFGNDSIEIEPVVSFVKVVSDRQKTILHNNRTSNSLFGNKLETFINLSYFGFRIKIHNTGPEPIEEYNLKLDFDGQVLDISVTNETGGFANITSIHSPIAIDSINKKVKITPKSMLVSDDSFVSDEIFIKPKHDETKLIIKWKLLAKDFTENGELSINIKTNIQPVDKYELIEGEVDVRVKIGDIEDCLIPRWALE